MSSDPITGAIQRCLESLPESARLKVAYSGGVDSHVLLHALAEARDARGERALSAIHVNHGLHPEAGSWASHCERVSTELGVPLEVVAVRVRKDANKGPEAAAREARYAAFEKRLEENDVLLLAHHQDDQAETFLLQLLRGAGPAGLSAMPASGSLGRGRLLRPLLEISRDAIRNYALRFALDFIDDPSNDDTAFDRNYLRREIMPRLRSRWPAAGRTIARAAGHQAALARVARDRGLRAMDAAEGGATLGCRTLATLDADVARLALRQWLQRRGFTPPSKVILDRILNEVVTAAADAEPLVTWPGAEVRRYRGKLYVMPPLPSAEPERVEAWAGSDSLKLPQGELRLRPANSEGMSAARLRGGSLEVRFRRGGERCRPAGQSRSSTLKACFQRRGVVPWERDRTPLIFVDGELAAVAGQFVCEGFQCAPGEAGLVAEWTPVPPP